MSTPHSDMQGLSSPDPSDDSIASDDASISPFDGSEDGDSEGVIVVEPEDGESEGVIVAEPSNGGQAPSLPPHGPPGTAEARCCIPWRATNCPSKRPPKKSKKASISLTRQKHNLEHKLAQSEANNAHMAAAGSHTKKYGKGEKSKTPRSSDVIEVIDGYKIDEDRGEVTEMLKATLGAVSAASKATESPSNKRHRGK